MKRNNRAIQSSHNDLDGSELGNDFNESQTKRKKGARKTVKDTDFSQSLAQTNELIQPDLSTSNDGAVSNVEMTSARTSRLWTREEDELLIQLMGQFSQDPRKWEKMAPYFPRKNRNQLRNRWCRIDPQLNKSKWTPQEDGLLRDLMTQYPRQWTHIAQFIPSRSGIQCKDRWKDIDPAVSHDKWTADDDRLLFEKVETVRSELPANQPIPWTKIAAHFPSRNVSQVRNRYINMQPDIKKGAFTAEEDAIILQLVDQQLRENGVEDFRAVAMQLHRATDRVVDRWESFLNPSITHDQWSVDEIRSLILGFHAMGTRFVQIRNAHFPHRASSDVFSKWKAFAGPLEQMVLQSQGLSRESAKDQDPGYGFERYFRQQPLTTDLAQQWAEQLFILRQDKGGDSRKRRAQRYVGMTAAAVEGDGDLFLPATESV